MDSYQAVYDAVRSKLSNGNVGDAVERVAREMFDISHTVHILQGEFCAVAEYAIRPSVLYRPSLAPDGSKWCALYGEDLATGVAGFGDTPAQAMADFDQAWAKQRTPYAQRSGTATADAPEGR